MSAIVTCETCGAPAWRAAIKRCDNCWEVESRLENYLKNPAGQVFARYKMPLLDDWVNGEPDAWDYEAVLAENYAEIVWSDFDVNDAGWSLTWQHGCLFIGNTIETIARKAAALFVSLWLRGVSASFADKLMDGFIVFLERQDETALSFSTDIDFCSEGRPFFRLTRENFTQYSSLPNVEGEIIEALNIQPGEEVIITFRKRKI